MRQVRVRIELDRASAMVYGFRAAAAEGGETEDDILDPHYAQAWAGLADGYTTSGYSGFQPAAEVMPRALEAARRALQLDADLAGAHNAVACATLLYELKFDLAEREFQRALELNPSYPQARAWYGLFFLQWVSGREREARDEILRLLVSDLQAGFAETVDDLLDQLRVPPFVALFPRHGIETGPRG